MDQHAAEFRKCRVPLCQYEERRGTRQGDFANGKFVCPDHAAKIKTIRALSNTKIGARAIEDQAQYYPELKGFL